MSATNAYPAGDEIGARNDAGVIVSGAAAGDVVANKTMVAMVISIVPILISYLPEKAARQSYELIY